MSPLKEEEKKNSTLLKTMPLRSCKKGKFETVELVRWLGVKQKVTPKEEEENRHGKTRPARLVKSCKYNVLQGPCKRS